MPVVFTTEQSLKDTYGDEEASGLMKESPGTQDNVRLEKAALTAASEILDYMFSAGYTAPWTFTPYGEEVPVDGPEYIPAKLQSISDCFTAWHLSQFPDLGKKAYDACRAEGIAYLEKIRVGDIRLTLNGIVGPTGSGNVRVIARPQVFDRWLRRPNDIWPGYPH